jgi:hypothetical protein
MDKEFNYYRQELTALKEAMDQNEFHFFLTLKDTRHKESYRSFRRTDEWGYAKRDEISKRVMGVFRSSYRIRSPKRAKPEYFDVVIHEAGVGRSHVLTEDAGHLHIAIGFTKESRFYQDPLKHFPAFEKALKRLFPWLDCCLSLANRGAQILIEDQVGVGDYMSKHERGAIDGSPFFKRPSFWNVTISKLF